MEELKSVLGEGWQLRKSRMGRQLLTRCGGIFNDKIDIYIGKRLFFVRSGAGQLQYPGSEQNYFAIDDLKSVKVISKEKRIWAQGENSSIIVDLKRGCERVRLINSRRSGAMANMLTFSRTEDPYHY